ncbi:MAG: nuclear transport factor 2 family protein [Chloroflexi bacterium]|nr:nuclear transport factor 2 family protein [Chloroflexota bacterium]
MTNLLQTYIEYVRQGDAHGLASLFAEDGEFYDDGFTKVGIEAVKLKGRENIEDFFKGLFAQGGLNVSNACINHNAVRYDITHGDLRFRALGVLIKEKNGLIGEYRVTVA